jgi:hypothetical protein
LSAVTLTKVDSRVYATVDDLTLFYRALIVGRVRDELTGSPLQTPFAVTADRPDMQARPADGGLYCFAGRPEVLFPQLNTTAYTVNLVLSADGFRDAPLAVTIPVNAVFPVLAPDAALRRLPVRVQGRVVENATGRAPIPGAKITLVDDPSPPSPLTAHPIALRTPLRFAHAGGVTVNRRALTASATARHLTADAPAGSRTLVLDNRTGLGANKVLRLGPANLHEYAVIESLPPEPGTVRLHGPLIRSFPKDAEVRDVTPGPVLSSRALAQDADAGDGLLLLNGILSADTIEIAEPAPAQKEYHALGALSDAEGFYRLDGMGRAVTLFFDAGASGFPPLPAPVPLTLDFGQPVNVLNFRL